MKTFEVRMRAIVFWRVEAEHEQKAIDAAYDALEAGEEPYDIDPDGMDTVREVKT